VPRRIRSFAPALRGLSNWHSRGSTNFPKLLGERTALASSLTVAVVSHAREKEREREKEHRGKERSFVGTRHRRGLRCEFNHRAPIALCGLPCEIAGRLRLPPSLPPSLPPLPLLRFFKRYCGRSGVCSALRDDDFSIDSSESALSLALDEA